MTDDDRPLDDRDLDDDPMIVAFRRELAALPGPPEFDKLSRPPRHRVRALGHAVGWALKGAVLAAAGVVGLAARGAWTLAGDVWGWWRGHDFRDAYAAASERGRARDMQVIGEMYRDAVAWRRGRAGAWLAALTVAALIGWHRAPILVVLAVVLAVAALAVVGARGDHADEDEFDDDGPDDVIEAEIVDTDGPPGPPPPWPLRDGGTVNTRRGVPVGWTDGGEVIAVPLDRHLLCAGTTGSGKSMMIRSIALGALADRRAEVHCWSAKSDRDFRDLAPACTTIGGGPASMGELAVVLERIVAELPAREDAGAPPCVVALDELPHALAHGEHGGRIERAVTSLAELGRSGGVVLVCGVQRPTKSSVPLRIMEQLECRVGLRVRTPGESRVIFGEDAQTNGLRPDRFPPDQPGLAWIAGSSGPPVRVRGWPISEADAAEVVRRAVDRRADRWAGTEPSRHAAGGSSEPAGPLAIEAPTEHVDTGCPVCGEPVRSGATYCTPKCRTAAYRRRRGR